MLKRSSATHSENASSYKDLDSRVALFGHPIHAMLVAFPISGAFWVAGCDAVFWWTGDPFFARAAIWGSAAAFIMGCLAAISGAGEMMLVPGARRRPAAWSHAVIAMALLAVLGLSWMHRMGNHVEAVLPWGLVLSMLSLLLAGFAGWHGGKLVFEHGFGVASMEDDEEEKTGGGSLSREP
ncbi:DUF2231 domain-containing protein [Salinarimonas sp.]|uniref:DUF2231 domain-containing protein n=1 Tax=Salinarimonas sp. TaxID=2766526 RepID=UPI00391C526A